MLRARGRERGDEEEVNRESREERRKRAKKGKVLESRCFTEPARIVLNILLIYGVEGEDILA